MHKETGSVSIVDIETNSGLYSAAVKLCHNRGKTVTSRALMMEAGKSDYLWHS